MNDAAHTLALAIEASNPSAIGAPTGPGPGAALARVAPDGTFALLATEPLRIVGRHADDQLACILRACHAASIQPRHLRLIAISGGPGGFTALRIAVATAKMLALAASGGSGTPCRAACIPTAHALAHSHRQASGSTGTLAVALAGKADVVHLTVFDPDPRPSQLRGPDAAAALAGGALLADDHLPPAWRAACAAAGVPIIAPRYDPVALFSLLATTPTIDPADLAPIYGREPEAVALWRARHASSTSTGATHTGR